MSKRISELRCVIATVLCIIFIIINASLAMAIRDNFWPMTLCAVPTDGIYTHDRNGQSLVVLYTSYDNNDLSVTAYYYSFVRRFPSARDISSALACMSDILPTR